LPILGVLLYNIIEEVFITMRILIIEDEAILAKNLKSTFEAQYYAVDIEGDGEKGLYRARTNDYDLIVLDDILPSRSGSEICRMLREIGRMTPILCISVQLQPEKRIGFLNDGADDYLTKPFSYEEIGARVRALLRRPKILEKETITIDDLVLDYVTGSAFRGEKSIYLTAKEFALLFYLMRNQGRIVSRAMLFEHVWDSKGDFFSNTIEMHIRNLRRKIDTKGSKKTIHTVPGRGYKMQTGELIYK
jgi:two-component system, OmpR family, response regulator